MRSPAAPALDRLTDALNQRGLDHERVDDAVRLAPFEVAVVAGDGRPKYLVVQIDGAVGMARLVDRDPDTVADWLSGRVADA